MQRHPIFSNSWHMDRIGPVFSSQRDTNLNVFKVTDWDFAKGECPHSDPQILSINNVIDVRYERAQAYPYKQDGYDTANDFTHCSALWTGAAQQ